ncbi:HET-domain-containing protein [Acephala macrosclerotiorum]|nr:HET-domain-containing protein [Acephala macrosclerotiorum]
MNFISDAINRCNKDCGHRQIDFLPTRLIDVSPESGDGHPRLVITDKAIAPSSPPGDSHRYAALSYCWGDAASQLKTELTTLLQRLQSIPIETMPEVMRDAVAVCRALSTRYLWVDSLCVIQDDKSDWENESEVMGLIYQSAHVTICALSSNSSHQGFLPPRWRTLDVDFLSSIYPQVQGRYTFIDRGQCGSCLYELTVDLEAFDEIEAKWSSRGWTFQEKEMSTRLLSFGFSTITIQCANRTIFENGLEQLAGHPILFSGIPDLHRRQKINATVTESFEERARSNNDRHLTFATDRLPALAGMAKIVADHTKDEYLAGLWKISLHRGLLWRRHSEHQTLDDLLHEFLSEPYTAPSWSWASRQGLAELGLGIFPVENESHLRPEYKNIESWTVLAGQNRFGEVRQGTIKICSRLTKLPSRLSKLKGLEYQSSIEIIQTVTWNGNYVAHCNMDWYMKGGDARPKAENRRRIRMLLISSACSNRVASEQLEAGTFSEEDLSSDASGESIVGGENGHGAESRPTKRLGGDEEVDMEEKEGQPDTAIYSDMEVDDDGEDLATSSTKDFCELCSDESHNRHAWGLILYPTEKCGQYYRIGVFTSRAMEAGGTDFFRDIEYSEIEII